jgi:hypothetical protein
MDALKAGGSVNKLVALDLRRGVIAPVPGGAVERGAAVLAEVAVVVFSVRVSSGIPDRRDGQRAGADQRRQPDSAAAIAAVDLDLAERPHGGAG